MATDTPTLVPIDLYNIHKAKWKANISWLVSKSESEEKYQLDNGEIFSENSQGELNLNTKVEAGLLTSELYWDTCRSNFGDPYQIQLGHAGVIQLLLRRGLTLFEEYDDLSKLPDLLKQTSPINYAAHVLLIDAMMLAYTSSLAPAERVVQAVRKFATFSASSELPSNSADLLLFWLNKCCAMLAKRIGRDSYPVVTSVRHLSNGRCLASVISFYRPNDLNVEEISSSTDVRDSIRNFVAVDKFCRRLSMRILHLSLSDLYYGADELLPNISSFLADLFHCLESLGMDNFQPHREQANPVIATIVDAPPSNGKPPVVLPAISDTTKRSFRQVTPTSSTQGIDTVSRPSPPPSAGMTRNPLLPRRQMQYALAKDHSQSLVDIPKSRDVWGSRPQTRIEGENADLLSNASINTSLDLESADLQEPWASAALSAPITYAESFTESDVSHIPHHASSFSTLNVRPSNFIVEPLMAARLHPAKEKSKHDSKWLESGETAVRKVAGRPPMNEIDKDSDSTTPSDGYRTPLNLSPLRDFQTDAQGDQRSFFSNQAITSGDKLLKGNGSVPTASYRRSRSDQANVISDLSDDAELYKLQTDVSNRESGKMENELLASETKPDSEFNSRTSFAKLRKWKENKLGSLDIYSQQDNSVENSAMSRSTFFEQPPQMTWMEAARIQRSASERNIMKAVEQVPKNASELPQSQAAGIRMKLEQRRRLIELGRKRTEQQRSQVLHQIGQDAFVQMIRKKDRQLENERGTTEDDVNLLAITPSDVQHISKPVIVGDRRKLRGYISQENELGQPGAMKQSVELGSMNVSNEHSKPLRILSQNATAVARLESKDIAATQAMNRVHRNEKIEVVRPAEEFQSSTALTSRQLSPSFQQNNPQLSVSVAQVESGNAAKGSLMGHRKLHNDLESFDRLSCSLSDLQAEITRLTARQDEIKNLVSSGSLGPAPNMVDRDQFYLYPPSNDHRSVRMASDIVARQNSYGPAELYLQQNSSMAPRMPYQPISGGYEVDQRGYVPTYRPYGPQSYVSQPLAGSHGPYPPPLSSPLIHRYPISTAYAPQYQHPQASMYPPYHQQSYSEGVMPWPNEAPFYMASPTNEPRPMTSPTEVRSTGSRGHHEEVSVPKGIVNAAVVLPEIADNKESSSSTMISATQSAESPPVALLSPSCRETLNEVSLTQPTAFFIDASSGSMSTVTGQPNSVAEAVSTPRAKGFFINFEQDSPGFNPASARKASSGSSVDNVITLPPSLINNASFVVERTNDEVNTDSGASSHRGPDTNDGLSRSRTNLNSKLFVEVTPSGPHASSMDEHVDEAVSSPSLVFVIPQEQAVDDQVEIEKRRLKFQEQQAKRREEQEQRRLALELELNRKRETQRIKIEEEERKRLEEKARRDAIFEKYMQRKMAVDEAEIAQFSPATSSKPSPATSNVVLRKKSATGRHGSARPMSQPPPSSVQALSAASVKPAVGRQRLPESHASEDNLVNAEALSTMIRGSNQLNSTPDIREALLHGGLTHRRHPTPERSLSSQENCSSTSSLHQVQDNYSGPKLYVKPSQKSNRFIMINAISHCCLAGVVNKENKEKVLEEIAKSAAVQFIILFRDAGMQYRGLYTYNPDDTTTGGEVLLTKIHGTGPKQLSSRVMEKFYKYNSGAKSFSEVKSTKHLTATIDAVTVLSSVWQKNRATAMPAASGKKTS